MVVGKRKGKEHISHILVWFLGYTDTRFTVSRCYLRRRIHETAQIDIQISMFLGGGGGGVALYEGSDLRMLVFALFWFRYSFGYWFFRFRAL
jgi:hypothetical protein